MYLTVRQQMKNLSKKDYETLRILCHTAKNLANEAIYNVRQHYFSEKKYLSYQKNYAQLKSSVNYRMLNSNMAQQILKEVDGSFKSFFGLLKRAEQGKGSFKECRLPKYLPKDGYTTLVIGFVRLRDNKLIIPFSNSFKKDHDRITITIPPILKDRTIKEIRIIPKADARFFEIQYTYEEMYFPENLNKKHALALDMGVDNLVTAVSNRGKTFVIDGRKLKAVNQWYNKEYARFESVKDKQKYGYRMTNRQASLTKRRNNRVNDYMSKAARKIIDYCILNDIGTLIVGWSQGFQKDANIGKRNNQNFVNIPYGRLIRKLEYLCKMNGIDYIKQEESYTSKASFWDMDEIPVYNEKEHKDYRFSGKRIHRGLYRTADGKMLNADVNGALNIMRKSNVVSLNAIYTRGEVDTPVRIRIA